MSKELTTADVAGRLGASERTVRKWCEAGLFEGAYRVEYPVGSVWAIPASALKTFERPVMGRPPKAKADGAKKGGRK